MDDNKEKYGIELETNYSKFSKDMESAGKLAEKLAERVERTKKRIENATSSTESRMSEAQKRNIEIQQMKFQQMSKVLPQAEPFKINVDSAELDLAKRKLSDLITQYAELKKQGVSQTDTEMLKLASDIAKAKKNVDKLTESMAEADNEANKLGTSSKKIKNNIENAFGKGVRTLKRFSLSLFGIHSIWRLISRASSEALATSDYQTSRLSVSWNALGQIMLPLIEKLITGFQYVAIFVSKVVQLFTRFNSLSKVTTKNINSTTSAVKNMTKTLGGFDELTNLESSSGGTGLASGLENDLKALKEFQERVKEVESWMEKNGITTGINKIKDAVKIFWTKVLSPFWEKALYPMLSFLVDHPNILATVFSIFLGSKLIGNISKILGSASAGTGLLGINKVLLGLASIGIITLEIKLIYDEVKKTKKAIENMAEAGEEWYKVEEKLQKNALKTGATTEEVAIQFNNLKNQMDLSISSIDTMIKGIDDLTFFDKVWQDVLLGQNSTLAVNTNKIVDNIFEINRRINEMNALGKKEKLTEEQEKKWIETLKSSIPKMEEQRNKLTKGSEAYNDMQTAIDNAKSSLKKFEDGTITAKTPLENFTRKLFDGIKGFTDGTGKVNNFASSIKNAVDSWKNSKFEDKTIKIKTSIETIVSNISNFTNTLARGIKNAFTSVSKTLNLSNLFKGLNSFDVGTNYVPNDQLAYVHKGEAIVPKEFNSSEFFGRTSNEEVVNAIRDLQATLEAKDMNAYISKKDIGQASIDYINQQNRIMGRSVL